MQTTPPSCGKRSSSLSNHSIVRLRSEPFSNRELAYFFVALVCAIDLGSLAFAGMLVGIALLAAWVIDHPRLSEPTRRLEVTLELVFSDDYALRRHLEERLNASVRQFSVLEIDYVRETTRAEVRYVPAAWPAPRASPSARSSPHTAPSPRSSPASWRARAPALPTRRFAPLAASALLLAATLLLWAMP